MKETFPIILSTRFIYGRTTLSLFVKVQGVDGCKLFWPGKNSSKCLSKCNFYLRLVCNFWPYHMTSKLLIWSLSHWKSEIQDQSLSPNRIVVSSRKKYNPGDNMSPKTAQCWPNETDGERKNKSYKKLTRENLDRVFSKLNILRMLLGSQLRENDNMIQIKY